MTSETGMFLRKLRIDHKEKLKDMARKLKVSSSFLSAVELGKKKLPLKMAGDIENIYNLDDKQAEELAKTVIKSQNFIRLNLIGFNDFDRSLISDFILNFENLNRKQKEQIVKILRR